VWSAVSALRHQNVAAMALHDVALPQVDHLGAQVDVVNRRAVLEHDRTHRRDRQGHLGLLAHLRGCPLDVDHLARYLVPHGKGVALEILLRLAHVQLDGITSGDALGDHQLESRSVSGYIANSYDDDILYTGDYDTANSLAPYGITTGYVDSHNGSPTSPTYSNFSGYVVDPPKSMRVSLSGVDDNYTYTWHLIVEMHKRGSRGEARPFIDHNKGA